MILWFLKVTSCTLPSLGENRLIPQVHPGVVINTITLTFCIETLGHLNTSVTQWTMLLGERNEVRNALAREGVHDSRKLGTDR